MVYQPPDFHGSVHKEKMPPMSASLQGVLVQWLQTGGDQRLAGERTSQLSSRGGQWTAGHDADSELRAKLVQWLLLFNTHLLPRKEQLPRPCTQLEPKHSGCCCFTRADFSFSVVSSHRPLSPLRPKWPFSLLRLLFFFHSVYPNLCVSLPPIQILLDSDMSCPFLQLQYLIQLWAHNGCSINSTWMKDEYQLEITHSPLLKVWLQPTTVI